jgi:hypothetical protein
MKLYQIAAATLLVGTSALAWQPAPQTPEAAGVAVEVKESSAETSQQMKKAVSDVLAQAAAPKLQPASATTLHDQAAGAGDPDLDLAVTPEPIDVEAADTGEADTSAEGVGGPLETAALDLATRPAAQDYPPCRPGPGDDNCIQLYEPGVRTALAAWNRPTGGLSDGDVAAVAMGGPYEPVGAASSETAMNGDGLVDGAFGESADFETVV